MTGGRALPHPYPIVNARELNDEKEGTYVTRNVEQSCRILDLIHMRGAWGESLNRLQRGLPDIPRGTASEHTSELLVSPRHPDEVSGS